MNLQEARKRIPELDGLSDESALSVIQQVYYPDMDRTALAGRLGVKLAATPAPERTWGQALGDTAVQLAEGVNTTLGAVPSIVAPEGAMAGFFRGNAEHWRDKQSDVLKERIAGTDQRIQEAGKDGVMSQIGTAVSEYWNDPAQAARLVATNLPSMAATLGTGAAAGIAAKGVAAARGMDAAGKAALAAKYGTTTAAATNAALNAGGARGEAFEDLQQTALAQGMSPEQAEQAGVSGSILPGVVGGVAGAISGKMGLEKALLGQATTGAATRKAAGAFGAELAGEQIEELAPKVTTNYQVGHLDAGRGLTDDLGRTIVETAIGSGPGAVVAGGAAVMRTPAQEAADAIRATETLPESGPMTRATNAATEAKAQAIEAGAPLLEEQAAAEPVPEPVDDPVRDQILALPDGARQDALRAYAVVNRDDVAKGVLQYNRKLLDRLLAENQPKPVLGDRLTDTDMGAMLGGGGMMGNADPLMGALGMNREAQANSITNVAQAAESRPPMPASDAARMMDEARNRGLDLAVAEHPAGGFVIVPPAWITPDMAAQGETRLAETIARMQQADAAPVDRAPRNRISPVELNLPTDPVQNYMDTLRTVNTPAARAYVRDFDAGRITPANVQQRMVTEQGKTPDQRIAQAAAEAPAQADPVADRLRQAVSQAATAAPTDILNPAGLPFKTKMAADRAAKKTPGAVVPVEGGFVVRPQEPVNVQDVPQAPEVPQAAPAISQPDQAPQAVGAQPAGPAAGVPAEGAGAVEAAGVIPEGGRNEPQTQANKAPEATESVAQAPAQPLSAPVGDEQPFAPESGTLGIPRAEMPQVPTQSHGGLVKHLNAQGIDHETTMVDAAGLKPTQAEFSPSKVEKAKEATGDRAVIVSSDGHIIDGHHQALAAAEEGKPVKAIVLDAPVAQALDAVKNSPSATVPDTQDAPAATWAGGEMLDALDGRPEATGAPTGDVAGPTAPAVGAPLDALQNQPVAPESQAQAATKGVANQPITRTQVDSAVQQASSAVGARIDAMSAQEVQKIAARFLPTMGVKVPAGKARIKAAMTDPKVNIQAAADEVGAVLSDDVKQALQADVEGRVDDAVATKNEATTANSVKAKAESGEGAATKSAKPIEDAGEKIGGARKDRWKERGLNLEDLDAMTESEGAELATKANVWKPDYEAMSEASEPVTAAMVKTIYDQLAAKPKKNTPEGRRQYVQMMRIVHDVLTEAKGPEAVKNAYLEIRKRAGLNTLDPKAKEAGRELLFSVYKGRSDPFVLGGADLMKAKRMVEDGFPAKGAPWKARLVVGRMEGGRGTTERGVEIYMERSAEVGTPLTREQILDGFYRVVTKDNKTAAFAATKADAEAAAATVYERDMKGKKDGKPEPVRPNLDELKRENLPKRIDRDVAADDFVRDLGFRGIEFGNWSAQDERQRILNMAYDGLMDLAEIMGVPPKAMSLNGTLGMAFGARGGGRFAAHYEPGKLVINMTKIRGGGSMAHEWAHALDHYFGELDKADAYTTQARGASGWYAEDQYVGVPRKRMERVGNEWKSVEKMRLDNLRPEMAAAFDEVMRALFSKQITKAEMVRSHELDLERTEALARNETQADLNAMYQNMAQNKRQALNELRGDPEGTMYAGRGRSDYASQAQALSGKSENGYWTRPTEMFARAFESWVFDRVTDMGARSDYLVHGVEEDRFAGGAYKGNPYPAGEERARINAAFDKLAKTIQTKETDKGVAMFSRRSASGNRLPDVVIGHKLGSLSSHPDYEAAKAGDSMAAARIASDLVDDAMVEAVRRAAGNADLIVPVVSVEATGRNKIPLAVARELADRLGSTAETEIVQADSPKRTSMDGLSRLLNPPVFDGPVTQGAAYVLVDDTVTQGGTFASLASHIRDNGGEVAGAVALTGKQYSAKLEPSSELLQQVRDRFQSVEPAFRSATGYGFDALTESEARYLVKHDDAESVRNRILAAGSERVDGGDRGLPQAFARQQGSAAPADSNSRNVATQRLVDGLKAKWTRAPEIIVARNMQDNQVPQRVRDYDAELKSQGSNGEARGFIYQGKVYLLSDELRGPQQIATVLFHEVLGHYGLRGAFGDSLTPILKQLGALRRKEVLAKAREYGMVRKNMSDADTWAALSERDRLSAAEEVLAEMAQSTPELGYVQRAIAAIRTWLRQNVPGFNRLKLTDDEIVRSYILPARGFVTRSSETPQQSLERALLAFSREGDPRSPFAQEVDAAIKAGMQGDTQSLRVQVPMGIDTPPALQLLGVDTKPVYTHRDLIAKMHFEHGVPRTALHGLDKLLSDPVMVFKSDTQPGRFVVVTNLVVGGNPVVVAVDPNGKSGRAEVVYLPSAYQKDNADRSFSRWIQAGLLRYANKEESRRLATTTKLQLPGVVQRAIGFRVDYKTEADLPATGKNAAQAPDEPQPMFSRTTDAAKAVGDTLKSVTATNIKKRAGFKFKDYLGLGLQALGRRQIVDIYGDMLPMAEYNRLVQQMEADKNEGGAEADKLVKRWAGLPDESKLADLMHEATLAQIDPAADFVDGDDKGQYLMLRRKYNLLSDDAKTVYRETRDAYKAHHAQVRAAIKERIERSEIKGERKAALLKQMDDDFFAAVKGVYFPLARFGQYVVTVKGPDGKVESVGRAETMAEADALRRNLLSAFPRSDGFTVGRVMLSKEFVASRDAVGRGFMTELYQVLDKQDMDATQRAELEDTLGQLYLSSLPDLSWAKHGIHRKGTPGFSQDARRAYAQNMFHGARYLAKLRYSDLMQDELTAMQKHVDDWREVEDFDQTSAQRVVDEMNKRHESLMNPKSNPLSTALTSFGFIFHLGLSPASAMVNLSQTALVAYPIMGAKWGFGKASAALLKASADAAKGKNDITASLNEDELAAYNEAVRAGTIDVTMAHDLAGIAQGEDAGVMWKIRPVMRWASFLFHHAERFNRQVTFVAAYRLAREAGSDHAAAFEQATKATYDGHFDYGAANRPRIMQGNVAKVLLLFKQYGQNMVYTLARNAQQAIKAETPEARAQARKALGGLLATHAMAAGVLGLPMVTTLLAAASMVGGDEDEPWDAKVALQNMLADAFGQKPAEVLAHGLSRLTPGDISGRVGLDRLIFPDVQEGLEGQRLWESAATQALGPVGGIFGGLLKGADLMSDGHYQLGLEAMLPAVLRQMVKSVRYASEGVQDKSGVVIKDEVSAAGVVGQFLGFSPSEVRLAQEGKGAVYQQDKALANRRQELLGKAARATRQKDAEARAEAMKEIERFNQKNPTRRITPLNVLQSVRNRNRRIDQAEGGIYLPKNRRDAMQAGRFAVAE